MKECNEMSWEKCDGCRFLMDVRRERVEFLCSITGKTMRLTDCIYCDKEEQ